MKKILFTLIPALALVFLFTSCNKDDDDNSNNSTVTGTWNGTGQYGTSGGNPTYVFTLNFKANGTVDIVGDNTVGIDNATGTWVMAGDSVKATYTYINATAQYTLAGKFTAGSNTMVGTIGLGTASSGVGLFSVSRTN